jgi:hypothetical protein
MNIETAKNIHEKYNVYEITKRKIFEISNKINDLLIEKEDLQHKLEDLESYFQIDNFNDDDDYLEMGSPFHKKLEATLAEWHIDRRKLKIYLDISSIKYMTKGQARKILDNIGVYHDAVEHIEG